MKHNLTWPPWVYFGPCVSFVPLFNGDEYFGSRAWEAKWGGTSSGWWKMKQGPHLLLTCSTLRPNTHLWSLIGSRWWPGTPVTDAQVKPESLWAAIVGDQLEAQNCEKIVEVRVCDRASSVFLEITAYFCVYIIWLPTGVDISLSHIVFLHVPRHGAKLKWGHSFLSLTHSQ